MSWRYTLRSSCGGAVVTFLLATAAMAQSGPFLTAEITGVEPVETDEGLVLHIKGTVDSDAFKRAWLKIGAGREPDNWQFVGQKRKYPIREGVLGVVPLTAFSGSDIWQVVVSVEHKDGSRKEARYPVRLN